QSSQARQSRWYCRNRWESRSVPFFTRKPLLETVKGFFRLETFAGTGTGSDRSNNASKDIGNCNDSLNSKTVAAIAVAARVTVTVTAAAPRPGFTFLSFFYRRPTGLDGKFPTVTLFLQHHYWTKV
ncbi:hypothetical protein, partial [Sphingobacterium sp.]|uniref:hypothetical protein n=1 Tax=Sphingobacterium sp. TaxID=341027 RepID=UPI0031CF4C85